MTNEPHKHRRSRSGKKLLRRLRQVLVWAIGFLVLGGMVGTAVMLVFARETRPGPHIGDHWHASYEVWVCGERQPDLQHFVGGVSTQGHGAIHINPSDAGEEGPGAALGRFFDYGGYTLTSDSLVIPGVAVRNGDACDDGPPGQLRVFVDGTRVEDFVNYIPQDGDEIRIEFAP